MPTYNYKQLTNSYMINCCNGLILDVNWNSAYLDSWNMSFYMKNNLKRCDLVNFYGTPNLDMMFMYCRNLMELNVSNWNLDNVQSMYFTIGECSNLKNLDVSNWQVNNIDLFHSTFAGCENIQNLNTNNWNLQGCYNGIFQLFCGCSNLRNVNVTNWDLKDVESIGSLFYGCRNLQSFNPTNWNVSNCDHFSDFVRDCSNIKELDLSRWNMQKARYLSGMFQDCYNLSYLNLSGWNNMYNVERLNGMFNNCRKLTVLDTFNWNINQVIIMNQIFNSCYNLQMINLSSWNLSYTNNLINAFSGCNNLFNCSLQSIGDALCTVTDVKWPNKNLYNNNIYSPFYNCNKLININTVSVLTCYNLMQNNWSTYKNFGFDDFPQSPLISIKEISRPSNEEIGYQVGEIISFEINVLSYNTSVTNGVLYYDMDGEPYNLATNINLNNNEYTSTHYFTYTVSQFDLLQTNGITFTFGFSCTERPNNDQMHSITISNIEPLQPHLTLEVISTTTSTDPTGYNMDETIDYAIRVVNDGNVDLEDITIEAYTDSGSGEEPTCEWTISSLEVGNCGNFTDSYTVTPDDIINGNVIYKVYGSGTISVSGDIYDDPEPGENLESTVAINAHLTSSIVLFNPSQASGVHKDDTVIMAAKVVNDGNVPVPIVSIASELLGETATNTDPLYPGDSLMTNYTNYTVTAADQTAGNIPCDTEITADTDGWYNEEYLTVTEGSLTIPVKYRLTINYLYYNGDPYTNAYVGLYSYGQTFNITSPEEPYEYTCNRPTVSGTMPQRDATYTVLYVPESSSMSYSLAPLLYIAAPANGQYYVQGEQVTYHITIYNNGIEDYSAWEIDGTYQWSDRMSILFFVENQLNSGSWEMVESSTITITAQDIANGSLTLECQTNTTPGWYISQTITNLGPPPINPPIKQ